MKTKAWRATRDVESKITELFKLQANASIPQKLFPGNKAQAVETPTGIFCFN